MVLNHDTYTRFTAVNIFPHMKTKSSFFPLGSLPACFQYSELMDLGLGKVHWPPLPKVLDEPGQIQCRFFCMTDSPITIMEDKGPQLFIRIYMYCRSPLTAVIFITTSLGVNGILHHDCYYPSTPNHCYVGRNTLTSSAEQCMT